MNGGFLLIDSQQVLVVAGHFQIGDNGLYRIVAQDQQFIFSDRDIAYASVDLENESVFFYLFPVAYEN